MIDVQFSPNSLWHDERQALDDAILSVQLADLATNLDELAAQLRARLPDWFIYQGGSHVAIHRKSLAPRLAMLWIMGVK